MYTSILNDLGQIDGHKLLNNLNYLCSFPESGFYYRDHQVGEKLFRIYLYRITSQKWWSVPGAVFGRGTVYQNVDGRWILISLCMPKFFNVGENDLAVQWSEIENDALKYRYVSEKHDGSLISAFYDLQGDLQVKSKGSFTSDQAVTAKRIFEQGDVVDPSHFSGPWLTSTVNYEYVSPDNLIVVRYDQPKLIPLNTVDYVEPVDRIMTPITYSDDVDPDEVINVENWIGSEGVVAYLEDDGRYAFKLKSRWYLDLHAVRSEITSAPKLARAILNESFDDLRTAFPEFEDWFSYVENSVITEWNEFWYVYNQKLHHIQQTVTDTGDDRQVRKARALSAKAICDHYGDERDRLLFSRLMTELNGGIFDNDKAKEVFVDRAKNLNVPDIVKSAEL